jgi:hypothetical protein
MKDIIYRKDATEAIASAIKEPNYQHEGEDWMNGLCQAEQIIDAIPSVDAIPTNHADFVELKESIIKQARTEGEWIDTNCDGCKHIGVLQMCEMCRRIYSAFDDLYEQI